jgi:hypothetical protein
VTIGNVWLGSMQMDSYAATQDFSQNLNPFTLSNTLYTVPAVLDRITVKVTNLNETLTVTLKPAAGSDYQVTLYTASTNGQISIIYFPSRPLFLYPGDTVTVNITNNNHTGSAGVTMTILY